MPVKVRWRYHGPGAAMPSRAMIARSSTSSSVTWPPRRVPSSATNSAEWISSSTALRTTSRTGSLTRTSTRASPAKVASLRSGVRVSSYRWGSMVRGRRYITASAILLLRVPERTERTSVPSVLPDSDAPPKAELLQGQLRPGPSVPEHGRGGRGRQAPACGQVEVVGVAVQEAGGVQVARSRRVDDLVDGLRRDRVLLLRRHDDRSLRPAGQAGDVAVGLDLLDGLLERGALVQHRDLVLVGEDDVDAVVDEPAPFGAVALHAEAVRQGERCDPSRVVGQAGRQPVRLLRLRPVPEVALEIGHLRGGDQFGVEVARTQQRGGAQIGAHGALAVWR